MQCVVLLVIVMAASPSLFISSQDMAVCQSSIEKYEEVSVECSSCVHEGVAISTWWYLVFVRRG